MPVLIMLKPNTLFLSNLCLQRDRPEQYGTVLSGKVLRGTLLYSYFARNDWYRYFTKIPKKFVARFAHITFTLTL